MRGAGSMKGRFPARLHMGQGSDGSSEEATKEAVNNFAQTAPPAGFPLIEYALDVNTRGDELRGILRHDSQESLPTCVDERDRTKIDRACASVLSSVPLFPLVLSSPTRGPTNRPSSVHLCSVAVSATVIRNISLTPVLHHRGLLRRCTWGLPCVQTLATILSLF